MVEYAKPRLVEGPICKKCGLALTIIETLRSEGASIQYVHRDDDVTFDHAGDPTYRVIRP